MDFSVVFEKIRTCGKIGFGYNAYTEEYVDMIPAGLLTPPRSPVPAGKCRIHASCVVTTESLS